MRLLLLLGMFAAADDYQLGPDSAPKPGVPKGTVIQRSFTSKGNIYPGTTRDYWIYVPAQYDRARPACVMVFQDGAGAVKTDGNWRVPVVFDNLIAAKQMPVTIGVFVSPGVVPPVSATGALPRFNRSYEYDGLGDLYARFLLDELLPEVGKSYNLTKDPECRAIGGASSGAIAAFTAAWERPDAFRRVFSAIGTYVGQRGGDGYPTLVRKSEPRPLRVFLQDGSNDQNIYGGNWWINNQSMLSALEYAGYEVNHAWGEGGHTGKHGGSILPEALRWLWKDFGVKPIAAGAGSKQPVLDVVSPGEPWRLVGEGYGFTEGPSANARGELFFSDGRNDRIHKVGLDGKVTVFASNAGGANGMMFGPDGKLVVCQSKRRRVTAYDTTGKEAPIAEDIDCNDLAVAHDGKIYVTDTVHKQVWLLAGGTKRAVDTGITFPNGVRLTPDQSLLYVSDTRGRFVHSFQRKPDGTLAFRQPFCHLHVPDTQNDSGADGMTVDSLGRLYVATHLGVQICDQAGRVIGIVSRPAARWLASVAFAGPAFDDLYATAADKLYRRKTKAKGVLTFQPPITPPTPKL
jgi:gluconolactonase